MQFVMVADYLSFHNSFAIGEHDITDGLTLGAGAYFRNGIIFVFEKFV